MPAHPLFDLADRRIVLTGAAGWLGAAMTRVLAESGATVFAVGRNAETLQALAAGVSTDLVRPVALDVQDHDTLARFFDATPDIQGVVNNAAVGRTGSMRLSRFQDYAESYKLLVGSVAETIRLAAERMEGGGSIVNVSSMYGVVSPDPRVYDEEAGRNPPFYGASKAALLQLTRYAAAEFGARGVRVNAVCPGPFPNGEAQESSPEFIERLASRTMLRRIGQPEECAGVVAFLLSDASRYMTGSTLMIDGGWTAW